jgi:hypothetical protein
VGISDDYIKKKVIPQLQEYVSILIGRSTVFPGNVRPSKIHGFGAFATRDIPKGEVIEVSMKDLERVLGRINDAACFPSVSPRNVMSFEDVKSFYENEMMKYNFESQKNSNIRSVNLNDDSIGERAGSYVALKDIKKGEEILRSYGILSWIAGNPQRIHNSDLSSVLYNQWTCEVFPKLWREATETERVEVEQILANHFMMHEMKKHQQVDGEM